MNDEENRTSNESEAEPTCPSECDPVSAHLPCADANEGADTDRDAVGTNNGSPNDGDPNGRDEQPHLADPTVSADPLQDADPRTAADPADAAPTDAASQLEQLRGELKALREEIAARDARLSKTSAEYAEFRTLYPSVPFEAIDDCVMEDVKRGIPISAAYALAERRRLIAEEQAARVNRENRNRTAGAILATDEDYFSPDEVRQMTRQEVRTNYPKILASMKKWH